VVKVGFICEGRTEKKIVESEKFQTYLSRIGIETVGEIRDAEGNGNLLPQNLHKFVEVLLIQGAKKIVIVTDLDNDACITLTKSRINSDDNQIVIVAVKQVESWFLADSGTLSTLLKENFEFSDPEDQVNPFETLKDLFKEKNGRGIGTKTIFARHMLKYGFSVENAAQHPNCPSAAYFLKKLKQLTEN
jgi:hypothetical protein